MEREIKFRAWDEINKIMVYPKTIEGTFAQLSSGDLLNRYEMVMQFTGLFDKNGREIYEGDILKSSYNRDTSGKDIINTCEEVEYEINQWAGKAGYEILFPEKCEVIGSIYESPEPLTPEGK